MSDKTYSYLMTLIGVVCGYVIVRRLFFTDTFTLRNALVQGVLVGYGMALFTIEMIAKKKAVRINGWTTVYGCGLPGNNIFIHAALTRIFPGPVNVPQEAIYWRTNVDGAGDSLSGEKTYILHFPPGELPPCDAFWSLTMADTKECFVANPVNRYKVGNYSGLQKNLDGSVDIYIQNSPPPGHEINWLPSSEGNFKLWLRAYLPGKAILEGSYFVPSVLRVKDKNENTYEKRACLHFLFYRGCCMAPGDR